MKIIFMLLVSVICCVFFAGCIPSNCYRCKDFSICEKYIVLGETIRLCRACANYWNEGGLFWDALSGKKF